MFLEINFFFLLIKFRIFARMEFIINFLQVFWDLSVEMAPWLLLGLLFSGILHVFLPNQFVYKQLGGKSPWNIFKAVLFGIPLPLCSCGVLPTAVSLHKDGASKATTNAFLISTPQTGIDSIFATYAMMGLPFAILRPIVALISGVFGGINTALFDDTDQWNAHENKEEQIQKRSFWEGVKEAFRYGFVVMMRDIGKYLLIGLVLATLVTLWVPEDLFRSDLSNFYLQFLVVLLLSLPLYICATGSIPIAVSLLLKGMDPSLVFLFLMAGPATNIASVALLIKALGRKTYGIYLFSIMFSAVVFTLLIHFFIPAEWFINAIPLNMDAHGHHVQNPGYIVLTIVFLCLLLYSQLPIKSKPMEEKDLELNVEGMTCNHCKVNVEKNIKALEGVQEVVADPEHDKVYVKGNIAAEKIKSTIDELGYQVKD